MVDSNKYFNKKTLKDYDLAGKTVLVRVDYNVPISQGRISDDYRVEQSLDTINYLLKNNCRIVLIAHLGRPKSNLDQDCSLKIVLPVLKKLLPKTEILFAKDCIGPIRNKAVEKLQPRQILLLENLRYHKKEEANDSKFAEELSQGMDLFVQDGFGVVHRAHASTSAITEYLPSISGLLLEREVVTIRSLIADPPRPLMAIIGGAKIMDKIELINIFIDLADIVVIGGAMANTFLKAQNINVGKSLYDKDELAIARDILTKVEAKPTKDFNFVIPFDGVVSETIASQSKIRIVDWDTHVIAEIENYPKRVPVVDTKLKANERILDIGPFSGAFIAGLIQGVKSVIWNGTLGVTEVSPLQGDIGPFAHGTNLVIEALLGQFGHRPFSLVGGGDTAGYISSRGLNSAFDHVSTGGGASLELMAMHKLPGVEALLNK